MNNIILIIGIFLSIIVICCFYKNIENYKPYINPNTLTESNLDLGKSAPWIPKKTPIPEASILSATPETAKILSESVDPGAHLECQSWCEKKGGHSKTKDFMQVCIDTCIQEKWRNPNSKITEYKPLIDNLQ